MAEPRSDTARKRAARWGLAVEHVLYRRTGDWYHKLERFPGALLDEHGYIVFDTREAFELCPWLRIRQDVGVPNGGIKKIPGYVWVDSDSGYVPQVTSYERELIQEGYRVEIILSKPERDANTRRQCLEVHGFSCKACDFDFSEFYGPVGSRYIHVHHLFPLSEGERLVDPATDLVPLCANCHSVAHRRVPPFTVLEIRQFIHEAASNRSKKTKRY